MEKIVFLDRSTLRADIRRPNFPHEWTDYDLTKKDEIVERLRDATIAVTNKVALRKNDLEKLSNLRLIVVTATGTDSVDKDYCRENGITVENGGDYSVNSVPEHVFTLLLALRRHLIEYRNDLAAGKWEKSPIFTLHDHPIHELHDSTLGIIGYGTLGAAVEKIAAAFGMKILIGERRGAAQIRDGRVAFEDLLSKSDVVTLHCPLNDATRSLIGADELGLMKPNALLINCGRGGLVDEKALAEALQTGKIAGAGVDVLSSEPPSADNPLIAVKLPNLLVTPHVAWASIEAMQVLADTVIDKMEAFAG